MLRFDFSTTGVYNDVPRGFERINLDEHRAEIFAPGADDTLFTPPAFDTLFTSEAGQTVAIAGDGVVTFAGDRPDDDLLVVGNAISTAQPATRTFVIESVSNVGVVTVTRTESNPQNRAADVYSIEPAPNRAQVSAAGVLTFEGPDSPPDEDLVADVEVVIGTDVYTISAVDADSGEITVTPATFRMSDPYIVRLQPNRAAIAANGVVTITGRDTPPAADIAVGNYVRIGDVDYVITAVNAGVPTVTTTAAVAAALYSVRERVDFIDEQGFTLVAIDAGDLDFETIFGNVYDGETMTAGDWIKTAGRPAICKRVKQASTCRNVEVGYY